jgi:hypothetical protein
MNCAWSSGGCLHSRHDRSHRQFPASFPSTRICCSNICHLSQDTNRPDVHISRMSSPLDLPPSTQLDRSASSVLDSQNRFCPKRDMFLHNSRLLEKIQRTVMAELDVLVITISEAQPPPAENCGKMTAPAPPIPGATCGTGIGVERFVTGRVLKLEPRKRQCLGNAVPDSAHIDQAGLNLSIRQVPPRILSVNNPVRTMRRGLC